MRYVYLILITVAASTAVLAQEPQGGNSRAEILKNALARNRGDISVMEPSSKEGGGVYIGYSSGALLHCHGEQHCNEFKGTSNVAVIDIAVTRRGGRDIVWVAYPLGAFYRCVDYRCQRFEWDISQTE